MTTYKGTVSAIRQRQHWDEEVLGRIYELGVLRRRRPAEVRAELLKTFRPSDVPHEKTILRLIKDYERARGSAWSIASASPDELRWVMPVLQEIAFLTQGELRQISAREAAWIVRIRLAEPDLVKNSDPAEAIIVFLLAVDYALREQNGEPTDDLDLYLMWAPWRNELRKESYRKLVEENRLPRPRFMRFAKQWDAAGNGRYLGILALTAQFAGAGGYPFQVARE